MESPDFFVRTIIITNEVIIDNKTKIIAIVLIIFFSQQFSSITFILISEEPLTVNNSFFEVISNFVFFGSNSSNVCSKLISFKLYLKIILFIDFLFLTQ